MVFGSLEIRFVASNIYVLSAFQRTDYSKVVQIRMSLNVSTFFDCFANFLA